MKIPFLIISAFCTILAICSFSSNSSKTMFEEKDIKEFSFSQGHLIVDNNVGAVTIASWPHNTIQVMITKKTPQKDMFKKITALLDITEHKALIKTRGSENNSSIDFVIKVPCNTTLETISTHVGAIKISGITRPIQARTDVGAIEITGAQDSVSVSTSVGNVHLQQCLLPKTATLDLKAHTGSITLVLPKSSHATLHASSDVGAINSQIKDVKPTRNFPYVSSQAKGSIGTGDAHVIVKTNVGSITLKHS